MENRRNFLKGAGILGAFFAGRIAYAKTEETSKDISEFAPESDSTHNALILSGGYERSNSLNFINPKNSVSLSVGKDNRLWIRVGDEWKRVAIEG